MEQIRTEFEQFKKEVKTELNDNKKYYDNAIDDLKDEILNRIKPIFTTSNKIVLLLALLGYSGMMVQLFNNIDDKVDSNSFDINNCKVEITEIKELRKESMMKIDKIYNIVLKTNVDVAVLKSQAK